MLYLVEFGVTNSCNFFSSSCVLLFAWIKSHVHRPPAIEFMLLHDWNGCVTHLPFSSKQLKWVLRGLWLCIWLQLLHYNGRMTSKTYSTNAFDGCIPDSYLNVASFCCQNMHEQQFSQAISKNLNFEVDHSPHRGQEVKYIDFQLQDQHSSSTESTSLSQKEFPAMGKTCSQDQCASSDSGNDLFDCTLYMCVFPNHEPTPFRMIVFFVIFMPLTNQ